MLLESKSAGLFNQQPTEKLIKWKSDYLIITFKWYFKLSRDVTSELIISLSSPQLLQMLKRYAFD